jgi:hypothetical protein
VIESRNLFPEVGETGEKKCKYCSMMIPADAKICPHCRKKQGMRLVIKFMLAILALGVIASIGLRSMRGDKSISSPVPPTMEDYRERAKEGIRKAEESVTLTEIGEKIKKQHPTWSNSDCNTIGEKKIHLGMTSEQVRAAWGKPYMINTTVGSYGKHEQWLMHNSISPYYVYFDNGILTSIQQSH